MKRSRRLVQKVTPAIARLVPDPALKFTVIYLEILQGRGGGSGWDRPGEARAEQATLRDARSELPGAGANGPAPAPVVVNVGANRGQWATWFLERCPDAQLVLIEPSSNCVEPLRDISRRFPGTKVVNVALSAQAGEAELHGSFIGSSQSSLFIRRDTYWESPSATSETVEVRTLDGLAEELGIGRIDLLKMDCEGSELDVLKGSRRLLESRAVEAISFEFGSANIYSRVFFRDIWDFLIELHGFELERIRPGGRRTSIKKYDETLEHFRGATNYIATLSTARSERLSGDASTR